MKLPEFFAELKQRNVYKVAVSYAVVAWLLVQIATQVFPFFEVPNSAVRVVVLAMVVGFPVALVLAWAFELTPEGWKRSEDVDLAKERRRESQAWVYFVAVGALLAVGLFLLGRYTAQAPRQGQAATAAQKSIAILPFGNLSQDPDSAYFSEGIQDDVLTDLTKVADLKVISRRSAAQFRAGTKSIREIAQALGVAYLLEGSVARAANRIHVTAQLIDTRTEAQTWAERYDRELTDVFDIQNEIAKTIVSRLHAAMSKSEKAAIEQQPTRDMQAYDLYLRAKHVLYTTDVMTDAKDEDNYATAVDLLNKAVAADPKFLLAYCLLIDANVNLFKFKGSPPHLAAAEQALQAAMRMAPDAGETHLAHGLFYYWGRFDFDHALEELEVAAQSLPNNVDVALVSARTERRLGRWTDSVRHFTKASELDPRDYRIRSQLATTLGMMRRYDEAIRVDDRAIADFPEKADSFRQQKAGWAANKGDLKLARATLDQMSAVESKSGNTILQRYDIALLMRDYDEADRAVAARANLPNREFLSPDICFSVYVAWARGEKERARVLALEAKRQLEGRLRQYPKTEAVGYWLGHLAQMNVLLGAKEEALRAVDQMLKSELAADPLQRPELLETRAVVYCWLGDRDKALQQLEELAKMPNGATYGDLRYSPTWDPLRPDPRFQKLLTSLEPK